MPFRYDSMVLGLVCVSRNFSRLKLVAIMFRYYNHYQNLKIANLLFVYHLILKCVANAMDVKTVLMAFIATTLILALILTPISWPFGFSLWIIIVLMSLLVMVRWHSRVTVYRCPECGHVFSISMIADLVSPHGIGREGGWKLLTCPKCGSHVQARASSSEETTRDDRS